MTFKIPLNRFITLVKPYLNVAGGAAAAWLIAKANVLGIPGLGEHQNELATGLAAAGTALLTWGASQLADLKWLKGHHIELEAIATTPLDTHSVAEGLVDHVSEDISSGELPSDEEEFSAPPPPAAGAGVVVDAP